jgi:hypothetical protein
MVKAINYNERSGNMSLFLPSNLSPNFEEITSNVYGAEESSIDFQF